MKWWLLLCGFAIAFFIILALLIIRVELVYRRQEEDDRLSIEISTLGGLIRFKRKIPVLNLDTDETSDEVAETRSQSVTPKKGKQKRRFTVEKMMQRQQQAQQMKSSIGKLYPIIKSFLAKIHCEQLIWRSTIGTGDAAETGTLTGLIWSIKTVMLGFGTRYLKMETTPELNVIPDFYHPRLETYFACILKFRLGQAILTGIHILIKLKKYNIKNKSKKTQRNKTANEAS